VSRTINARKTIAFNEWRTRVAEDELRGLETEKEISCVIEALEQLERELQLNDEN